MPRSSGGWFPVDARGALDLEGLSLDVLGAWLALRATSELLRGDLVDRDVALAFLVRWTVADDTNRYRAKRRATALLDRLDAVGLVELVGEKVRIGTPTNGRRLPNGTGSGPIGTRPTRGETTDRYSDEGARVETRLDRQDDGSVGAPAVTRVEATPEVEARLREERLATRAALLADGLVQPTREGDDELLRAELTRRHGSDDPF